MLPVVYSGPIPPPPPDGRGRKRTTAARIEPRSQTQNDPLNTPKQQHENLIMPHYAIEDEAARGRPSPGPSRREGSFKVGTVGGWMRRVRFDNEGARNDAARGRLLLAPGGRVVYNNEL
jgi:hypothetical protein